jgi:hypothetical protein
MYKYFLSLILLISFSSHASVAELQEGDARAARLNKYFEVVTYVTQEKWFPANFKSDASQKPAMYNAYSSLINQAWDCIVNLKKQRLSLPFSPQTLQEIDDFRSLNPRILEKYFRAPLSPEFLAYRQLWNTYHYKFIDFMNFADHIKLINDLTYLKYGYEALKNKEDARAWNTEAYYLWLQDQAKGYDVPSQKFILCYP